MSAHACPLCGAAARSPRGVAIHLAHMHGERSTHPKTLMNHRAAGRLAEPLPARPRDAVALLETVIALARFDAALGVDAADEWLNDLRTSIRRRPAR